MRTTLVIVVVGLSLWSVAATPRFWAVTACLGLAWVLLNVDRAARLSYAKVFDGARGLVLLALLATPALAALAEHAEGFAYGEGLHGVAANLRDRARLERLPSIHPGVLFGDHPQRLYVAAPGAERLEVSFGTSRAPEVDDLGGGLFRVRYDPRIHGAPGHRRSIDAVLRVDGTRHVRAMDVVAPAPHPRFLCASRDRQRAFVPSEETDELVMVTDAGLGFRAPVGDGPTRCVEADGGVYVAHRHERTLLVLDPATGRVRRRIATRGPGIALARSFDRAFVYVGIEGREPGVEVVRVADATSIQFLPLATAPEWLGAGSDGSVIATFRSERTIRRLARRGDRLERAAENVPMERPVVTLTTSADGEHAFATATDFREAVGAPPHPRGNHFVQDQILVLRTADLKVVGRHFTPRRGSEQDEPASLTRGVSPMGIDALDDGSLLVAFAGTDEVVRLDPWSDLSWLRIEAAPDRLPAPHGVVQLAGGSIVVSSPVGGAIAVYDGTRRKARVLLDDFARADYPLVDRRRHGERVFYEATRTGVSCASCHVHADTDHSVHNIGPRLPLFTLTVRGLAGTAPYLRDASHPMLSDLVDVSEGMLRGFLRGDDGRRRAIETYLASLPRAPSPHDPPIERLREGFAAFRRAGCDLCHSAPAFTNLGQHPIPALFPEYARTMAPSDPLDTPTLLGVHASAPYLQDGRAETLREVLRTHNRSNRHGDTAALDERAMDALVTFLEAL